MQNKVLWAAMRELAKKDPKSARAMIAVIVDGQTLREHADHMGVVKSTVWKWILKGRHVLMKMFDDREQMEAEVERAEKQIERELAEWSERVRSS